jgi:hypothetical protein
MGFLKNNREGNLFKDLAIILFSVLIAIILVKTGILKSLLELSGLGLLGSFIAGIFFTSIFTVAPATVAFSEVTHTEPLFWTVVLGGLGAMVGDLVIFRFVKGSLSKDFSVLVKKNASKRLASIFKLKMFRWFIVFLGALVIASPLPDEIGLAMMGLTKVKTAIFIPLSFALNSFGILVICLVSRSM